MNQEQEFIDYLNLAGLTVLDRRPYSDDPLPNRGTAGYRAHDFEADCLGICVHHAVAQGREDGESRAEQHAQDHLDRWKSAGGIAYTITIAPNGKVILCWDFNRRLYSQGWKDVADDPKTLGDENIKWKGVLVEGDFYSVEHKDAKESGPTGAQVRSLMVIHQAFTFLFQKTDITGHFEHGKPACPGYQLQTLVELLQAANVEYNRRFGASGENEIQFDLTNPFDLQKVLAHLGYYTGKIDGDIGPKSIRAIKSFQRDEKIAKSGDGGYGNAGPKTRGALQRILDS